VRYEEITAENQDYHLESDVFFGRWVRQLMKMMKENIFYPGDGGSRFFRSIGSYPQNYAASNPRML
jgi:hypothetical protein